MAVSKFPAARSSEPRPTLFLDFLPKSTLPAPAGRKCKRYDASVWFQTFAGRDFLFVFLNIGKYLHFYSEFSFRFVASEIKMFVEMMAIYTPKRRAELTGLMRLMKSRHAAEPPLKSMCSEL